MQQARHSTLASAVGLLILRLGIGGYMLTHGWGKLQMLLAGEFGALGDPIGIGSTASLVLMVLAEFICALLVMIGLGTRLAAVPVVIGMSVAAFVAHGGDPWTMGQAARLFMAGETDFPASKEPALLYLIVFLALICIGPGRFSLDALVSSRLRRQTENTASNPTSDSDMSGK